MTEGDGPLARPGDMLAALALLTRLPVPPAPRHGAATAWAWPLAGAIVAALAAAGALGLSAGLPGAVAAGLVLGVMVLATGALHEDGLADTADGLWGAADRARRLEIMRDSRLGSYGAVALILSLGLRWAALAALIEAGQLAGALIGAAMLSRAAMAAVACRLPPARDDGLSRRTGRPARATAVLAAILALAGAALLQGPGAAVAAGLAAAGAALALALLARSRIGGQTGDTLGATQQAAEIAALAAFAAG